MALPGFFNTESFVDLSDNLDIVRNELTGNSNTEKYVRGYLLDSFEGGFDRWKENQKIKSQLNDDYIRLTSTLDSLSKEIQSLKSEIISKKMRVIERNKLCQIIKDTCCYNEDTLERTRAELLAYKQLSGISFVECSDTHLKGNVFNDVTMKTSEFEIDLGESEECISQRLWSAVESTLNRSEAEGRE